MKIGDLEEGTIVGVLLRPEDVPWKLPQNVSFHCQGMIEEKLNGRYKIWVSQHIGALIVEQHQIKPLPFDHPLSKMCLVNRWRAYIQMNLWAYMKYMMKRFIEKIKYSNLLSPSFFEPITMLWIGKKTRTVSYLAVFVFMKELKPALFLHNSP